MLSAIFGKYLLNALLFAIVSIGYGLLKNRLGEDRANTIKEAILSAMLWAEEELGIGNGSKKWELAWQKLIEILAEKNINQQTYDILLKRKLLKDKSLSNSHCW